MNRHCLYLLLSVLLLTSVLSFTYHPDSSGITREELPAIIKAVFESSSAPGMIAGIQRGDETPLIVTNGYSDLESKQPFRQNDKVRIASITKTFTATIILQLQDEGKLSLNDPLSKYLPSFPNSDNITIEQIGNMTSGIFNYSSAKIFQDASIEDLDSAYSPMELIDIAAKHEPYFSPGKGVFYSNTNFLILGVIAEKITGNKISDEIRNRILIPLGLDQTSFPNTTDIPEPHARGYVYTDQSPTIPTDITALDPNWAWAAGAMISTFDDLFKYAKPLATGQLLSENSYQQRISWIPDLYLDFGTWKDRPIKYGFGLENFDGFYGHSGEIPGFNSFVAFDPQKDITIVVLVNMEENMNKISPADLIARKIIDALNGR